MTAPTIDDTAEAKRAWARDNGFDVQARGRLPKDAESAWQRAHASYDEGISEADFGDLDDIDDAGEVPTAADPPRLSAVPDPGDAEPDEERPSRPGRARRRSWTFRMPTAAKAARGSREKRERKEPKKHKWLSTRQIIEEAYGQLGWAAKPIPPLSRMFYAQAPVAGVILEPVLKGSLPDRFVLQPLARNYEKYKAAMGLMGPPFFLMGVLGTMPRPVVDQATGQMLLRPVIDEATGEPAVDAESGQPIMMPVMNAPGFDYQAAMVGLRYSIGVMVDACGGATVKKITERAAEREGREEAINEFLSYILGMPVQPMPEDRDSQEAAKAGLRLVGASGE